jgi:CSLREA domain-containing protein
MSRVGSSSASRVLSAPSASVRPWFLVPLLALVAAACVMLARAASRAAGPIIVNTTSDENTPGDGLCSLREAINNANAKSETTGGDCMAGTGNDTINFSVSGTIALGNGLPTIQNTLTIDGTGQAITVDGASSFPVFTVDSAATLNVSALAVANGSESAVNTGTLTITNDTFTGNTGTVVIINQSAGTLTVTGCTFTNTFAAISNSGKLTVVGSTFSNNSGGAGGGAISSTNDVSVSDSFFSDDAAFNGGAIQCGGGTATVSNSTFSGNSAAGSGGAIATSGSNKCTLSVTNSTFSGNNAFSLGGAIFNGQPGTITVTNSTFSGNGGSAGGGIDNQGIGPAAATITNSILAGNTVGNCGGANITDGGHNIDGGTTCGFTGTGCVTTTGTSFCNTNPQLDPAGLANNGGPTQTLALQSDSPAIDAGDETICAAPPVDNLDQRGFVRPGVGATSCSIGAYEFDAAPPSTPTPTLTSVPTGTPMPVFGVSGQVSYYSGGVPVDGVDVHLVGTTPEVATTGASGAFTFSGLSESDWTLEPLKQGGAGSGISTLDAVYVLQGVVGVRQFDFAQGLACDTSGDGTLSTLDAVFILQYVVGLIPRLPVAQVCGSDWAFVPVPAAAANQSLIQPQVTAGSCQHGAIALDPLVSDASGQDFSGVLFGDCSGDWQPSPSGFRPAFTSRSPSAATVRLGVARYGRSGRVRFPLMVESAEPFHALDFRIGYDPTKLRLIAVRPVNAASRSLIQYNANTPGTISVALASAEPIMSSGGTVVVLEFQRRNPRGFPLLHILTSSVDARSAGVIAGD